MDERCRHADLFSSSHFGWCSRQAVAASVVEAAGVRQVAARLLALEASLPLAAFGDGAWQTWEPWRRALARAETTFQLAPQVRLLPKFLRPSTTV